MGSASVENKTHFSGGLGVEIWHQSHLSQAQGVRPFPFYHATNRRWRLLPDHPKALKHATECLLLVDDLQN
jgi:hypothetical protein